MPQVDAINLAILGLSNPILARGEECTPLTAVGNNGNEQGNLGILPDEILKARRSKSTKTHETEGTLKQERSGKETGNTHPVQIILRRSQGR